MDKNTALDYMEKVVGYNIENLKPSDPYANVGQLSDLTKAQVLISKGKLPSKDLHMASYVQNFQHALQSDYENGVYYDSEDKDHKLKLEQLGESMIDSNLVSF